MKSCTSTNEVPPAVLQPPIEGAAGSQVAELSSPGLPWNPEAMAVLWTYPAACRRQVITESEECARSMGFHRVTPLCVCGERTWIHDDE